MANCDAREGKQRENWRMEGVVSTFTLPRNMVYTALLPLMRTPRLPVVDWNDPPADLNGLVRFAERRNLVSARVPSLFKRSIHLKSNEQEGRLPPTSTRARSAHDTVIHCRYTDYATDCTVWGSKPGRTRRFFSPPKLPDSTDGIPTLKE